MLLEQEQWGAVEVHPQFQVVVAKLEARAQAGHGGTANGAPRGTSPSSQQQPQPPGAAVGAFRRADAAGGGSGAEPGGQDQPVQRKFTITPHDTHVHAQPAGGQQSGPAAVLVVGGKRYHVVDTQLVLLSMLGEYLAFRDAVPAFSAEVAQRVLELLKVFNSRTCQLVLGAGAMQVRLCWQVHRGVASRAERFGAELFVLAPCAQVSGLKSITAKHLAVSCQCLGAFMALQPALADVFTQGVQEPRRDMLVADFGRALSVRCAAMHCGHACCGHACAGGGAAAAAHPPLPLSLAVRAAGAQDYRIHHDEITGKLVSIMRERLSLNIKQLPALSASWPEGPELPAALAPSNFAVTSVKQLQILTSVLQPLLLPEELHSIFGRISLMFSRTLAEAYDLLDSHGPAWEQQLRADVECLLNCLRNLPLAAAEREPNLAALTQLYEQRFVLGQRSPRHVPAAAQAPAEAPAVASTAAPAVSVAAIQQPGEQGHSQRAQSPAGQPAQEPQAAEDPQQQQQQGEGPGAGEPAVPEGANERAGEGAQAAPEAHLAGVLAAASPAAEAELRPAVNSAAVVGPAAEDAEGPLEIAAAEPPAAAAATQPAEEQAAAAGARAAAESAVAAEAHAAEQRAAPEGAAPGEQGLHGAPAGLAAVEEREQGQRA